MGKDEDREGPPGNLQVVSERRAAVLLESRVGQVVRASGGLVVRPRAPGRWEVAVVHRPHRADWSFPKGKLDPGESFEDCARREVLEETGLRCELDRFLGHTEYRDRKGRPKVVAYWLMYVTGGAFEPNREVDELRWVSLDEAAGLLSYGRDRELLLVAAALEGAGSA